MGNSKVSDFFAKNNFPLEAIFTGEDTSTVQKAAAVIGVQDGQIAKSLALALKDGTAILVTEGTARLDNRKFKDTFACKAKMLSADDTLAQTGFPVGGVCPFALPDGVEIYLDVSLKKYNEVYPAAGTRDSAVKIPVANIEEYTNGRWVDVCKEPEE